jgi:hypothetical protein
MQISRFAKVLLVLGVIGSCAWLQYLIDDGLDIGWPQNVVRNWEQLGFFNLHGKLVTNPGGFEAATNPEVYKGMSPVSLYPAFFSTQLFAWTHLGTLSFHILLALAVFWAIWILLGRDNFAFAVAAAAVLCPGYSRWQKILDPNDIAVLCGLPYMAVVVFLLKKPHLGFASIFGLFTLTLAFVSLNWTTAWVLGIGALLLLGLPQINRRAAILFIAMAGVSSGMFVIGSVIVKAGASHSGSGTANMSQLIGTYAWGDTGYGEGLTTGNALLRLSFVNGIGLLPLLVLYGWSVAKYSRCRNPKTWLVISPLALAVLEVGIMRNYFAHHPWMAAPVLLAGLVFSLVLLRVRTEDSTTTGKKAVSHEKTLLLPAIPLLCLIYGLAVMMFSQANGTNQLSLVRLIRHHTKRSDCVVILKSLDPETAKLARRFDEILDRRVVVADDLGHLPASRDQIVVLSSLPLSSAVDLLAQSSADETSSQSWLHKIANWFNHSIARRRPGDRMELADAYYLYELKR